MKPKTKYFERREGAVWTGTDRVDISFPLGCVTYYTPYAV